MKYIFLYIIICSFSIFTVASQNRWTIDSNGSISWTVANDKKGHDDHIEMSGQQVSTVVRYGVGDDGSFHLSRGMVWPMLRTIPNNTHASLMKSIYFNSLDGVRINGQKLSNEKVGKITLNGIIKVCSNFMDNGVRLTRYLFPSVLNPSFCEKYVIANISKRPVAISITPFDSIQHTDAKNGVYGSYSIVTKFSGLEKQSLAPGDSVAYYGNVSAYKPTQSIKEYNIDNELNSRRRLVNKFEQNLVFDSPDKVVNEMFAFAKIRAAESIYKTKNGFMHGPGGESYYAAIWANDQAEYVNPFFPYLGYNIGNESALTSYRMFAKYMNPQYKAIPSSIIAEGTDIWNGAGDRGDAAMIAYGASRYVMARGDKKEAIELWKLIEWCLEYCKRNLNKEGVVASNTDELEGRFPSGEANLCTSSLYYDALISSAMLGKELGKPAKQINTYLQEAKKLRQNIDSYFGGMVEGYDTYRYYKGNNVLRSWICIPLTVGITERKQATVDALFSKRLWTENGLLTQAGDNTYWDRSTLYALRGIFACGETEKALRYLIFYSNTRLLGEHVPYPIEAWPEGGKRHLSAESGLFCRIITEGILGIRPTGLRSFNVTPRLPKEWNYMTLKNICAFGNKFDIAVRRDSGNITMTVTSLGKVIMKKNIKEGETATVKFKI